METNETITYRKMTIDDIDQVLLIEEEAFDTSLDKRSI